MRKLVGGTCALVALAVFLTPALATAQNSVSINPYDPDSGGSGVPAVPSQVLLPDGSFENGAPPASGWTETADNACEWIGEWAGAWGVSNYDGTFDFWGGGYCGGVPSTDSVSQNVSIPADAGSLTFFYYILRVDADDAAIDTCQVAVDGTTVWSTDVMNADNSVAWEMATADISAWSGQTEDITASCTSVGAQTGNIRFDYFEFNAPVPTTPNLGLISLIIVLLVGGTLLVRRRQTA